MLTFLFALAGIWTLFWLVMLMLDWDDRTAMTDSNALCPTCAMPIEPGSVVAKPTTNEAATGDDKNSNVYTTQSRASKDKRNNNDNYNVAETASTNNVTSITAASTSANRIVKKPVADKHEQVNVTPLFEKPDEKDDLKTIKGIGVVMEQTLNDLGITTFKQLAGFQQAEVKLVSDVLSESKAGFGDRIERDEWVDQAKDLVKKAS